MVETPQLWLLSSNRLQSSRQPYRKQGVDHPTGSRLDICKLGICLRTIGVCDQHQRYQAARGSGLCSCHLRQTPLHLGSREVRSRV
jgi:hypothetical protein